MEANSPDKTATDPPKTSESGTEGESAKPAAKKKRHWLRKGILITLLILVVALIAARLAAPPVVRWYVNQTLDQDPNYDGTIGDIEIHLWRGAYSIKDIRISKTTGSAPVPFFAAENVDLALQWKAMMNRRIVGQIRIDKPELNFVDDKSDANAGDQTGAGAPWLSMIRDLFPFKINSAQIKNGSVHFRAFNSDPPVDLYLSQLNASIENLTNVQDDLTPLNATIKAKALAMDHANLEYVMKLDPFSYRPTFQMKLKLIGLNVTKLNDLTRAYGQFDFEQGWFDLVVEVDAKEGALDGYVKPLFRNLQVFSVKKDIAEDNVVEVFWEALVGTVTQVLKNQPRNQFGTSIGFRGDLSNPKTNLLEILGNVLRNAFIRAYLPRLEGRTPAIDDLEFQPGTLTDPVSVGD